MSLAWRSAHWMALVRFDKNDESSHSHLMLGWGGWGGSLNMFDPKNKLAFSYTMVGMNICKCCRTEQGSIPDPDCSCCSPSSSCGYRNCSNHSWYASFRIGNLYYFLNNRCNLRFKWIFLLLVLSNDDKAMSAEEESRVEKREENNRAKNQDTEHQDEHS